MPFQYWRDPWFLCCVSIYACNAVAEYVGASNQWVRSYLNDILIVPVFVPLILYVSRRLDARKTDDPPRLIEVVIPVVIWSAVFEVFLPAREGWRRLTFADEYDVVSYLLGGVISCWIWRFRAANDAARGVNPFIQSTKP